MGFWLNWHLGNSLRFMRLSSNVNFQTVRLKIAEEVVGDKPQASTKKYIPETGEWKATDKKRNQWLKDNGYTLGEDYYYGNGGQNKMSYDVYGLR